MQKFFGIGGLLVGLYGGISSGCTISQIILSTLLFGFLGLAGGWTLRKWIFRNTGL